ncbi:alanine racemase [archaeon]|nr:alanine racemase [archaeon]
MSIRSLADNFLKKLEKPAHAFNIISISRSAILYNYSYFRKHYPHSQIWPVLKSNAYGHGLAPIVSILKSHNPSYLIVDSYYEALKVRQLCSTPILLIGSIPPQNFSQMKLDNITLCVQDNISLDLLISSKRSVTFHLKVNTGMNRQGIDPQDLTSTLAKIKDNPQIKMEGVFSHLADADNPQDKYSPQQIKLFSKIITQVNHSGLHPRYFHLAASYSASKINKPRINAIRLGLGLYGYSHPQLRPALTFTSTVVNRRIVQKGDTISYNRTFTAKTKTNVGLIPAGYFEGFDRRLSNRGVVKYRHRFYGVAGRICMNLTCIDFKNTVPKMFDSVEIISPNPIDKNSIKNIARLTDTISYEILIHLHSSIRRQVTD